MSTGARLRAAAAELRDEVVELASRLIAVDTSNPPGRETAAAELLASYLRANGIESELIGPDPQRLNLVARLAGAGEGPSLMLMAHTDVVPAPREGWSVDPFAGALRDGMLIGRGACDMKGELAARAVALAELARRPHPPPGDIVLVAESDEERNTAGVGMSWLIAERPELGCDFALNEGGGCPLELADGRTVVPMSVGEKRVSSIRIRVHGRSGHASVPEDSDNPLGHVALATQRLLAARGELRPSPVLNRALELLVPGEPEPERAIAAAGELHPTLGPALSAIGRMTVTPTGLATDQPANVIPPYVDLTCDVRALPADGEDDVRAHVATALGGELRWELEFCEPLEGGTESELGTELERAVAGWLAERLPGAELLPLVTAGFTDSHWARSGWGVCAYGFAPVLATDPLVYQRSMHGADERIDVGDLAEMAAFHIDVAERLGAPRGASEASRPST